MEKDKALRRELSTKSEDHWCGTSQIRTIAGKSVRPGHAEFAEENL